MQSVISVLVLLVGFLGSQLAMAEGQHLTEDYESRGLQQARRVATMENSKDLPSRAIWLSQRVAKSKPIALQSKKLDKRNSRKKANSLSD